MTVGKLNTLDELFKDFSNKALFGFEPVVVEKMRQVFFCGALALNEIQNRVCNDKSLSQDAIDGILLGLHEEIAIFAQTVAGGSVEQNQRRG